MSREELLLENILGASHDVIPQSRVEILLQQIAESGGGGGGGESYAVKYISQSLSDSQKEQARTNIGAASLSDIGTVFTIKGSVATVSALPGSGNSVGDVYYVEEKSAGYIWLETTAHPTGYWEQLGETVDLSAYQLLPRKTSVTGSTPSITAADNTIYVCGEVSALTVTAAANISFVVIFVSGSTPATLTMDQNIVMPDGFSVEANTHYEINVMDGYAVVAGWAVSA